MEERRDEARGDEGSGEDGGLDARTRDGGFFLLEPSFQTDGGIDEDADIKPGAVEDTENPPRPYNMGIHKQKMVQQ